VIITLFTATLSEKFEREIQMSNFKIGDKVTVEAIVRESSLSRDIVTISVIGEYTNYADAENHARNRSSQLSRIYQEYPKLLGESKPEVEQSEYWDDVPVEVTKDDPKIIKVGDRIKYNGYEGQALYMWGDFTVIKLDREGTPRILSTLSIKKVPK
jgi:hypothetical protein